MYCGLRAAKGPAVSRIRAHKGRVPGSRSGTVAVRRNIRSCSPPLSGVRQEHFRVQLVRIDESLVRVHMPSCAWKLRDETTGTLGGGCGGPDCWVSSHPTWDEAYFGGPSCWVSSRLTCTPPLQTAVLKLAAAT
eukprot:362089-Chlamydomonas_euryale.AAC.3